MIEGRLICRPSFVHDKPGRTQIVGRGSQLEGPNRP
jgi:hypothetical protein